jgi:hypothetical protein
VARLQAHGLVTTATAPNDRRRTVVPPDPGRGARPVHAALVAALADRATADRAAALLAELATLLMPAPAAEEGGVDLS